nr:putative ribonuclease H-like domain-containing protein [Tanacetum cinerariifolium]
EEETQTYVLFLVLSDGSTNPKNNKDAHTDGKEHDDIQKSVSPDIHSSSCGDQTREQECFNNCSNEVNAVGSLVSAAGLNFTNITNDFSAAGPSNAAMPNLEDLSHNADDVGAEADINNMESIISRSTKESIKFSRIQVRLKPCKKNSFNSRCKKFRYWLIYPMEEGNCAFLYGTIEEEVYVCQPPGFKDPEYHDKAYKVVKALYGLHQAPRAWYETLATYFLKNGFQRETIDQALFIKKHQKDILLV